MKQLYRSSFKIRIDDYDKTIYCSLFAYDDENAIDQLPIRILERIGFITKNNIEIRRFINLEELKQEITKA